LRKKWKKKREIRIKAQTDLSISLLKNKLFRNLRKISI
jgi:hypothetical protein